MNTAADARPSPTAGDELSYVYAIGRDHAALQRTAVLLSGVDDRAVRLVTRAGGLAALVSHVPAGVYDEQALKAQLEDLSRLEAIARAHHAVVDAAFAAATVLPMRLATVYRDDDRVTAVLGERHDEFDRLLQRLDRHVEFGVKVYADPDSVPVRRQPHGERTAESPGRAYLQQRRAQRRTGEDVRRAAAAVAADAATAVRDLASERVVHRPQQGGLSGRSGENVANDAYLVPAHSAQGFRTRLDALVRDTPGVRIEVTGPWAPYSFAMPVEGGGAA
ncbi:GvpL/GvpF family gas vesicle protein [Streptomyces sp. ISL-10]|uniref:GvpL/GvpF family gas vesicle protein n=1 Tax=Streptomyces sp. ISL-10 TaxID=2819172 RepID=UPI001BE946F5|nr:GvpL/GvpF family gas vesicle protein [Streptomyces sp. ISL-10]MBT2366097.1 GvpL/GvpF family gas vesicle protein [Streptomyces sp. ISL-10]